MAQHTFDAVVIGSGMTGGWAAKELTDKGLKTLMIESGRNVDHIKDYPTTNMMPWEFAHRGTVPQALRDQYPSVNTHYIFSESTLHFLKKDAEQEYVQERPFSWVRGDQVGGRSLLWARAVQRWSDYDFEGPARDGYAVDWPIRYKDLAPWYSYVERFIGVSGNRDGLASLPDGEFLPPFDMTCMEKHLQQQVARHYRDRHVIVGRVANISEAKDIHYQQGRAQCQRRTLCERGCPYGGYFSSNASTIPWAKRSGNLTLLTDSIVHSIIYDEQKGRATGVRVIDKKTGNITEYFARLFSVNASTLNTNLVLLNSTSRRFPNGLGNDNGLMGKFIAFHSFRGRISAEYEGLKDTTTDGRRPTSSYMPRFRNLLKQETDFLRGYSTSIHSGRSNKGYGNDFGADLKKNLMSKELGPWQISAQMMGETIPKETSTARLDPVLKDKYGLPQLRMSVGYDDNDDKMLQDFYQVYTEMFEKAGYRNIQTGDTKRKPGNENHEMGGVRMGRDPKTSLLNSWNQLHACKNVLVTDGACMVSVSTQNPSLTFMALTARAINHAVAELKKGNL